MSNRLKVTLRPGIEFLEYLAPRDGRPTPADARASDLFHWQTTLIVNTADIFAKRLTENSRFVSPGVVTLSEKSLGFSRGLLARDPDGHVIGVDRKMNSREKAQDTQNYESTIIHSRDSRHRAERPRH